MTKNDILRMGREAGMHDPMIFIGAYERFAKLVAEREREECAKVCEETDDGTPYNLSGLCAAAIRARRNHD